MNKEPICIVDSAHGMYIPQVFLESTKDNPRWLMGINDEEREAIEAGPDHPDYWESWAQLIDMAYYTDEDGTKYTLYENTDLFAIPEGFDLEGWAT
jgi:hypothetical protein